MPAIHELDPQHLAVILPAGKRGKTFPRPNNWQPSASILLHVIARDETDGPLFALRSRHREEDAATAHIRSAQLRTSVESETLAVILKFQRAEAAQSASAAAIENRFDREQRALHELYSKLPESRRADIPRTFNPDGTDRASPQALRMKLPMVLCAAGHHALGLPQANLHREDQLLDALHAQIGQDASACVGCENYSPLNTNLNSSSIPEKCKPWIVVHREGADWQGLVLPTVSVLILSDMGISLQSHLEKRFQSDQSTEAIENTFLDKMQALLEWAKTMREVHRLGWMHLDLNLDNLCISTSSDGSFLRIIDFGLAERLDAPLGTFHERIPLRRVDFASPEMQLRSFPLRMRSEKNGTWSAFGLFGWPRGWWPAGADLIEVEGYGEIFKIEQTKPEQNILRITTTNPQVGARLKQVSATVHRSPGRSADLYSFGLIALCWLTEVQRPVLYRNELAVFEYALVAPGNAKAATTEITDANWHEIYRRAFGRYSVLLDQAPALATRNDANHESAFWECLRICIKCIVRHRTWSYTKGNSSGLDHFEAVVADLEQLLQTIRSGKPVLVLKPWSMEQYCNWLAQALPSYLARNDIQLLTHYSNQMAHARRAIRNACDQVQTVVKNTTNAHDLLIKIGMRMQGVKAYRAGYAGQSWFQRAIAAPLRGLLTWTRPHLPHDETTSELVDLCRKLGLSAIDLDQNAEDVAQKLRHASLLLPEIELYFQRPRYTPAERNRVERILGDLRETIPFARAYFQRILVGDTRELQSLREEYAKVSSVLDALSKLLFERASDLGNQRLAAEHENATIQQCILVEMKSPARSHYEAELKKFQVLRSEVEALQKQTELAYRDLSNQPQTHSSALKNVSKHHYQLRTLTTAIRNLIEQNSHR